MVFQQHFSIKSNLCSEHFPGAIKFASAFEARSICSVLSWYNAENPSMKANITENSFMECCGSNPNELLRETYRWLHLVISPHVPVTTQHRSEQAY